VHPPLSAFTVLIEGGLVAAVYVAALATAGFDASTRDAYAVQARRAVGVLFSAAGVSGRRTTNVDPDAPVSSSVTVP
ncbi:MAG TPA: hypothetical protein VFA43_18650, partial [Gemmatimonadaceae bacterium]|nr:hypothetical protein [Gemmatimonadaceae bacterium]